MKTLILSLLLFIAPAYAEECTPVPAELKAVCDQVNSKVCVSVANNGTMAIVVQGDDCLYFVHPDLIGHAARLLIFGEAGYKI